MKKSIYILTLLFLFSISKSEAQTILRVLSCNIRVDLAKDTLNGHGWNIRKNVCFEIMKKYNADIFCLQEVGYSQYKDLLKAFPNYFIFGYTGPEMDTMPDTTYHGIAKNLILFSKKRFELIGASTYWLAENPLHGGELSWGTARARHVNWVRLIDKISMKEFRICSTHLDHVSQSARVKQIEVFLNEASQYKNNFPQILCGDFNARPDNIIISSIMPQHGWKNVYKEHNNKYEDFSTHHFIGNSYKPKKIPSQIDYIFVHGENIKILDSYFIKDCINGIYPSDHYFLATTLELS